MRNPYFRHEFHSTEIKKKKFRNKVNVNCHNFFLADGKKFCELLDDNYEKFPFVPK